MDRRTLITAAALAPVAIAAPAVAQTMLSPAHPLDAAIAEYWRLRAIDDDHPFGKILMSDPRYEELRADCERRSALTIAAFEKVIDMPSRTGSDIGKKLEMVVEEYRDFDFPDGIIERIAADAKCLAA